VHARRHAWAVEREVAAHRLHDGRVEVVGVNAPHQRPLLLLLLLLASTLFLLLLLLLVVWLLWLQLEGVADGAQPRSSQALQDAQALGDVCMLVG
jgi:hypothetical protein